MIGDKIMRKSISIILTVISLLYVANYAVADNLVNPQKTTYKLLEQYLNTRNSAKRIQVKEAKGSAEILASRIYRAFDFMTNELARKQSSRCIVDAAQTELYRNPDLTIFLLWPVINEGNRDAIKDDDRYSTSPEEKIAIYIGLCERFAAVEDNAIAYGRLLKLSNHSSKIISDKAKQSLNSLEENNWKKISERYRRESREEDLRWLVDEYLYFRRYSGSSIERVRAVFGSRYKEDFIRQEYVYTYSVKNKNECLPQAQDSGPASQKTDEVSLIIHFFPNGELKSWQIEQNGQKSGSIEVIKY